jgi:hypothetical protein
VPEETTALGPIALPLRSAYTFGAEHGLQAEINDIKNMAIGWTLAYTSTVRRGYIVDLFEKHRLLEEFKATHWPNGNTPGGMSAQEGYLRIKQRYEDFLEDRAPPPDEAEEEADQQFAAEADLRDFLAKNPTCIEVGLASTIRMASLASSSQSITVGLIFYASMHEDASSLLNLSSGEVETRRLGSSSIIWVGLTNTLGMVRVEGSPSPRTSLMIWC